MSSLNPFFIREWILTDSLVSRVAVGIGLCLNPFFIREWILTRLETACKLG